MFNIQGSELIFLLLIALIVLGPEKLPDAVRKFGKAYGEFKKMANGFQGELRDALDEPMRELRGTADALRKAASFDEAPTPDAAGDDSAGNDSAGNDSVGRAAKAARPKPAVSEIAPRPAPPARREQSLNFGSANPRRQSKVARAVDTDSTNGSTDESTHDSTNESTNDTPATEDANE